MGLLRKAGQNSWVRYITYVQGLKPGEKHKVIQVIQELYVVVEGLEDSPIGGLYWAEFEKFR